MVLMIYLFNKDKYTRTTGVILREKSVYKVLHPNPFQKLKNKKY